MRPLVCVDRIVKRFATVTAVESLSFDVHAGEVLALLGPNGAGKTTTVRMMLGLLRPDEGSVRWNLDADERAEADDERPATSDQRRETMIGYLPEERGLYPDQQVLATLVYFGVLRGMSRAEARREAAAWLERFELRDRAHERLEALSKGNQQKVQFASAVLHRPRFLILDEPFSGLDPVNQELFIDIIAGLRASGAAIVLSAHQMTLVERLADRVWLLARGRTVLSGTLPEIRARAQACTRLVLETTPRPDITTLRAVPDVADVSVENEGHVVLLVKQGGDLGAVLTRAAASFPIAGVQSAQPSLHDIYVNTVREAEAAREQQT